MKKFTLLFSALLISFLATSQVFNTARTLKINDQVFRFGINPLLNFPGGHLNMFSYAELAAAKKVDIMIDYGWRRIGKTPTGNNYVGAAVKWQLIENGLPVTFTSGAHYSSKFGLDEQLNITIPFSKEFRFYLGPALNLEFIKPLPSPLSAFGGFEINLNKTFCLVINSQYYIKYRTYNVGGGLNIYF